MTHYENISHRAVRVLGTQTIDRMSDPQVGLLNKELKYLVDSHQSADKVTEEIEGAYEMSSTRFRPVRTNTCWAEDRKSQGRWDQRQLPIKMNGAQ